MNIDANLSFIIHVVLGFLQNDDFSMTKLSLCLAKFCDVSHALTCSR